MRNRTEIIMILATAVVLILFIVYDKYSNEGFVNENSPRPPVTTCPTHARGKVTPYYDKKDVMCCEGKVTNNKCESKPLCTLGKPKDGIKSCADWMAEQFENTSKQMCPTKLPNPFIDTEKGLSGCTDSPLKPNYKGPVRDTANKCNLYTRVDNKGDLDIKYFYENILTQQDSCAVQKMLEDLEKKCVGQDCTTFSQKIPSKNKSLIGLHFTDVDNVRRTCYEDTVYRDYIYGLNNNVNLYVSPYREQMCSNAKTLYIDKAKL